MNQYTSIHIPKYGFGDKVKAGFDWLLHNIELTSDPQTNSGPVVNRHLIESRGYRQYPMHKYTTCETGQCAEYANGQLRKKGNAIYGNAWNNNTKPLFDGYKGMKRPEKYDQYTVRDYNLNAADQLRKQFDERKLNKNKTYQVSMYYNPSPYSREAYNDGTNNRANTHVGNLIYDGKQWVVEHNFHGTVMRDPLNDLLGSTYNIGITQINTYKTGGFIDKLENIDIIFQNTSLPVFLQ